MKRHNKFCFLFLLSLLSVIFLSAQFTSVSASQQQPQDLTFDVEVVWEDENNHLSTRPEGPDALDVYLIAEPFYYDQQPYIIKASTNASDWTINGNIWSYKFTVPAAEIPRYDIIAWDVYQNTMPQHYFSYSLNPIREPLDMGGVSEPFEIENAEDLTPKYYDSDNNKYILVNLLDYTNYRVEVIDFKNMHPQSGVTVRLSGKPDFGETTIDVTAETDAYGIAAFDHIIPLIPGSSRQGIPSGTYKLQVTAPDGYLPVPEHNVRITASEQASLYTVFLSNGGTLTTKKTIEGKHQDFEFLVELEAPVRLKTSKCPPKWKAVCIPGLESVFDHYDVEYIIYKADGTEKERGILADDDFINTKTFPSLSALKAALNLPEEHYLDPQYYDLNPDGTVSITGDRLSAKRIFGLNDGESIVFDNLPEGVTYKVTELKANREGYKTLLDGQETATGSAGGTIADKSQDTHTFKNTYTKVDISAKKVWNDGNNADGIRPQNVTLKIYANGEETDHVLVLNEGNGWESSLVAVLDRLDAAGEEIIYTVDEAPEISGYTGTKSGSIENGFLFTNTHIPERPERPGGLTWFRFDVPHLPKTGFPAKRATALGSRPLDVNYQPLRLTLEVPTQSVSAEIVRVPYVNDEYAVEWLNDTVGLLEGSPLPGQGRAVITGHNHLNTTEAGPFAFLSGVEEGDRIYVVNARDEMQLFTVYAAEKIAEDDVAALERIAMEYENSLTLVTCEDEQPEGGYANRRIVAARPL